MASPCVRQRKNWQCSHDFFFFFLFSLICLSATGIEIQGWNCARICFGFSWFPLPLSIFTFKICEKNEFRSRITSRVDESAIGISGADGTACRNESDSPANMEFVHVIQSKRAASSQFHSFWSQSHIPRGKT